MLHIQKWRGAPPKDGISSWCEVQEVRLTKIPGDPDQYEYHFFVLTGTAESRVKPVFGRALLPAGVVNDVYGGLQVFDARTDLHNDGSATLHTLFIAGTEYPVEPLPAT